jgi:predicted nucleic acid-binding protein
MMKVSYGELRPIYSQEILDEYTRVLAYDRLNISQTTQDKVIEGIRKKGKLVKPNISTTPLTHEDDRIFYDAAKENGATLITGNIKHYTTESFIMTPADFMSSNNIADI